jgi:hypothetical protein
MSEIAARNAFPEAYHAGIKAARDWYAQLPADAPRAQEIRGWELNPYPDSGGYFHPTEWNAWRWGYFRGIPE